MKREEHSARLRAQEEKGKVLKAVILELHSNQKAITNGMNDPLFVAKVVNRIYHDRLVGVNDAILNTELPLSERVKAYFTDVNDAVFGRAMAARFGMFLPVACAEAYDIMKYTGDMRIDLSGDSLIDYIRYIRDLGGNPATPKISPATDGINHINIYSKGVTSVGRILSNFETPTQPYQTKHGEFASMEGLYHWLRVAEYYVGHLGNSIDTMELAYPDLRDLRTSHGAQAIGLGRKCKQLAYANTSYRPGRFEGPFFVDFVEVLIEKLSREYREGVTLGAYVSSLIISGFKLLHYYSTTEGVFYPPHGEWLPELITLLCSEIDPEGSTDIIGTLKPRTEELVKEFL